MEHWVVVACIDLQNFHILTSNPSLKFSLGLRNFRNPIEIFAIPAKFSQS